MISKELIRIKICAARCDQPFPLQEIIRWAEQRCHLEIARVLGELQKDLQEDEYLWQEAGLGKEVRRTRHWRDITDLLKAYYLQD